MNEDADHAPEHKVATPGVPGAATGGAPSHTHRNDNGPPFCFPRPSGTANEACSTRPLPAFFFCPGNFIRAVREGRAGKLDVEAAATLAYNSTSRFWAQPGKKTLAAMVEAGDGLFDGSIYSGEVAHRIGLVDAVGEMNSELRRR